MKVSMHYLLPGQVSAGMSGRYIYLLIFLSTLSVSVLAQTVVYDSIPQTYQLFPRDLSSDSAMVTISGTVDDVIEFDSLIVSVDTNGVTWKRFPQPLVYTAGDAPFALYPNIFADTLEYRFSIQFKTASVTYTDTLIDSVVCGDVFIIQGQSNAIAGLLGPFTPYTVQWLRSFGRPTGRRDADAAAKTLADTAWGLAQAATILSHSSVGVWGLRLGKKLVEETGLPIAIINGSPGGSSVTHHRQDLALTSVYGRLYFRAEKAQIRENARAMFWYQGEGNTDNPFVEIYPDNFRGLRNEWRSDYPGLEKFYITQIHVGYGAEGDLLREYLRTLALEDDSSKIVTANDIGGFADDSHFYPEGYETYGDRLFYQVIRDFYGSTDTVDIEPPNISKAYFTSDQLNKISLEFDNAWQLVLENDTLIADTLRFLKDYFYLSGGNTPAEIASISVSGNRLDLMLNSSSADTLISYLPAQFYNNSTTLYEGPWLKNARDIPALSFKNFPISVSTDDPLPVSLAQFNARAGDGSIQLNWRTESEIENLGFILLRRSAGQSEFVFLADHNTVPALLGQGSVNYSTDYIFNDRSVLPNTIYEYVLQDQDYSGKITTLDTIRVDSDALFPPADYTLSPNYPNPFNATTQINFYLPKKSSVKLEIFDIRGRLVKVLRNQSFAMGNHIIPWHGRDENDLPVSSGLYIYRFSADSFSQSHKMILLR